jgi:uncharacterized peroxidase-related enzyme
MNEHEQRLSGGAWIRTVPAAEASIELIEALNAQAALYPPEYAVPVIGTESSEQKRGGAGIVMSHSLIPQALYHAFALYGTLLSSDLPLSRRQHEMIAATVSALNSCHYWLTSHAEFLRRVTLDESLAEAIEKDYRSADLTPADRAMLDYAAKLTLAPARVNRADLEPLRAHGFDDTAILQINLIASFFNYINRVADGLGVGREEWFQGLG